MPSDKTLNEYLEFKTSYLESRYEFYLKKGVTLSLEEIKYFEDIYAVLSDDLKTFIDLSDKESTLGYESQLEGLIELEEATQKAELYSTELEEAKAEIETVNERLEESLLETEQLKKQAEQGRDDAEKKLDIEIKKKRFKMVNIIIYFFASMLLLILTFSFILVLVKPDSDVILSMFSQVVIATLTGALTALSVFVGVKEMIKDTSEIPDSFHIE